MTFSLPCKLTILVITLGSAVAAQFGARTHLTQELRLAGTLERNNGQAVVLVDAKYQS